MCVFFIILKNERKVIVIKVEWCWDLIKWYMIYDYRYCFNFVEKDLLNSDVELVFYLENNKVYIK